MWFEQQVKPRLRGRAKLVRYADDAVVLFEHEDDARRVMAVLPKRYDRYGLTLHPEKTRLLTFKRPDRMRPRRGDDGNDPPARPLSFDFLRLHHPLGQEPPRQVGGAPNATAKKDRFRGALHRLAEWCRLTIATHPSMSNRKCSTPSCGSHYGYFGRRQQPRPHLGLSARCNAGVVARCCAAAPSAGLSWAAMYWLLQRYPSC